MNCLLFTLLYDKVTEELNFKILRSVKMSNTEDILRKPEWLKIKLNTNESYTGLKK